MISKPIHIVFLGLLLLLQMQSMAQSSSFSTYMNPVIPGAHADPTLTRIGKDFYTTGSSFSPTPIIYHSTDLVHWEAIAQPVSATWSLYGTSKFDGCWGGHMVYYNNKYWDFFGNRGNMYFTTATQPEGPWSTPVKVKCPASVPGLGMDNSIFIDDDGLWYLLVKNGQENNWILQLGTDGQPKGNILDLRWINPAPTYPFGWAEGPTMWKYKGYYYYTFAINAGGGQKVFRTKQLVADKAAWENLGDFFNEADPKKYQALFTGPNHCSPVVMLDDSTSWVISHSYAFANGGEWQGSGRQGLLSRVRYNTAGKPVADYPINEPFTAPVLSSGGIPWMVPHADFFNTTKLNPEWSVLGYAAQLPWSLSARPGWVRLSPKNLHNTIIKYDAEHNYSLITRLDFAPKASTDEAGIRIMTGQQSLSACVFSTASAAGEPTIKFTFNTTSYEVPNTAGNIVWLKLSRYNHVLSGFYSANGFDWVQVGKTIDVKSMDVEQADFNAWTGNYQGLYVKGLAADFDLYVYRDAYTSILAECPANQWGTTRSVSGVSALDQIHTNDWALYAGVEFGDADYPVKALSFEANASSVAPTGVIEVWLDSIQTGRKIGECPITTTGSLSTYKLFSIDIPEVTGNHDVYLKFRGEGTGKLFQLKSFRFLGKLKQVTANQSILPATMQFTVFPNPADQQFTVSSKEPFSRVRILYLDGQVAGQFRYPQPVLTSTITFHPAPGTYFLEITTNKGTRCTKLVVL
ncbi:MAG TPA: family 43 glycosylhydrolase [Prolixibacteraceae bacterium]|jgi:beta-xylosidase